VLIARYSVFRQPTLHHSDAIVIAFFFLPTLFYYSALFFFPWMRLASYVSFISFSIGFAHREANQAAHSCGKYGLLQEGSFLWDVVPPAFLLHSFRTDCNTMVLSVPI
jgi:hypothetical protein